jgi:DNA-binding CsgD family transcriptional regulator
MWEAFESGLAAPPPATRAAPASPARPSSALPWRCLAAMLDEIDYGMVLLLDEQQVVHLNHVALAELDEEHPLQLLGDQLRARHASDVPLLRDALAAAMHRGLRRLLTLGAPERRVELAVVPLAEGSDDGRRATALVFGKRRVCEELSVQWFARSHGLTAAETQVLKGLCDGRPPNEIAHTLGVAISTVRTQIGSLRSKTGADSIRHLVQRVAVLPPLVSALGRQRAPRVAADLHAPSHA